MKLQSAQHIGRQHILNGTNMQDALSVAHGSDYVAGVICDGCSEGKHSEVGAGLASAYIARWLAHYADMYALTKDRINAAYDVGSFVHFLLEKQKSLFQFNDDHEWVQYVKDHLLFTVIGFVHTVECTTIFYCGDGTLVIDDKVKHLNVGDTPLYPAYNLIPHALTTPIRHIPFIVERYYSVQRLAIGSDAWKDEPDLLLPMFGQKHLQREINRLSDRQHRFQDDVSIITVESE